MALDLLTAAHWLLLDHSRAAHWLHLLTRRDERTRSEKSTRSFTSSLISLYCIWVEKPNMAAWCTLSIQRALPCCLFEEQLGDERFIPGEEGARIELERRMEWNWFNETQVSLFDPVSRPWLSFFCWMNIWLVCAMGEHTVIVLYHYVLWWIQDLSHPSNGFDGCILFYYTTVHPYQRLVTLLYQ